MYSIRRTTPYYRFKELNTLGVEKNDRQIFGDPVRAYWHAAETAMTQGMPEILKIAAGMEAAAAKEYITNYCAAMQEQAFADAGQLLNDVRWYRSHNSNTMKNGRNPETHEVIDELKPVDPMTVDLDAAAYQFVPPVPEAAAKGSFPALVTAIVGAAVVAAALVTWDAKKRKK